MSNQIEPHRPAQINKRSPIPAPPIHPLAALATLVLDNIFALPEILAIVDPLILLATGFTVGVIGTVTVACVQRYMAKDEWGPAIAKGLVMGVIAGVPTQVSGTAVGGLLLAWAGMHEWIKLPLPRGGSSADDHEIIDVTPK